jgi:hypothetical protein
MLRYLEIQLCSYREMHRVPAPRVVMRFSEKTGPPGVPEKPRTLLVLLLESASRDGQSASTGLAEIQGP